MKNIIIINGSPRRKGNSSYLADTLAANIEGANIKDVQVHIFSPTTHRFSACKACENCTSAGECVLNDDIGALAEALETADALIWISPLYFGTVTAQLKAIIDRFQLMWSRNVLEGHKRGIPAERSRLALALYLSAKDDPFKNQARKGAALMPLKYASNTAGFTLKAHHALIGLEGRADLAKDEFAAQLDAAVTFVNTALTKEFR